MDREAYIQAFRREFPYATDVGVSRLFHFRRVEGVPNDRLEHFFVEGKLYHSSVADLNDPFEARPHYNGPKSDEERDKLLTFLYKSSIKQGQSPDVAMRAVVRLIEDPERLANSVHGAGLETLTLVRMHSFTTSNSNLLMWSHYGDAHKGICVEFDATMIPICGARRVKYQEEYPEMEYPPPEDDLIHRVVLTKSTHWGYEEEFRSLHTPDTDPILPASGNSLYLPPESVTGVFFGASMSAEQKDRIAGMVAAGPFNPTLFDGKLSKSRFAIEFVRR
jgi:hypothetical protein